MEKARCRTASGPSQMHVGDKPVDENRAAFFQGIDGMVFGDSPSQGLVRGQRFLHPTLDIALTAPTGWALQNGSETLTVMSPQRGNAEITLIAGGSTSMHGPSPRALGPR